jgi:hypothetical protein
MLNKTLSDYKLFGNDYFVLELFTMKRKITSPYVLVTMIVAYFKGFIRKLISIPDNDNTKLGKTMVVEDHQSNNLSCTGYMGHPFGK